MTPDQQDAIDELRAQAAPAPSLVEANEWKSTEEMLGLLNTFCPDAFSTGKEVRDALVEAGYTHGHIDGSEYAWLLQ
jgi:hypothetical protein